MGQKRTGWRRLNWLFAGLVLVVAGATLFLLSWSPFGGNVSGDRLKRAQASAHYKDGRFVNVVPQSPASLGLYWDYLVEQFTGDQVRIPPSAIPVVAVPPRSLTGRPAPGLRAIWLGHASVYLELDGLRLLLDPVFSDYASPFDGFGPKRFHPNPIALEDLPKIHAVLISHDHYDHLDMATIQHLSAAGSRFFVPLGVGAHLDEWQVPKYQITELDWWDRAKIAGVEIVSTPTRHYSGREVFDQNKTSWSSWSILGSKQRVYYSGDTGFSDHFKTTGDRLGPFDLSIIKIGAYGPGASWYDIHMFPEPAIQAHLDLRARQMLPVHWATFNMAFHDWDEPIKRALKAAEENNVDLLTPRPGEVVTAGAPNRTTSWWAEVK